MTGTTPTIGIWPQEPSHTTYLNHPTLLVETNPKNIYLPYDRTTPWMIMICGFPGPATCIMRFEALAILGEEGWKFIAVIPTGQVKTCCHKFHRSTVTNRKPSAVSVTAGPQESWWVRMKHQWSSTIINHDQPLLAQPLPVTNHHHHREEMKLLKLQLFPPLTSSNDISFSPFTASTACKGPTDVVARLNKRGTCTKDTRDLQQQIQGSIRKLTISTQWSHKKIYQEGYRSKHGQKNKGFDACCVHSKVDPSQSRWISITEAVRWCIVALKWYSWMQLAISIPS